ncbi:MAG: cation:proton antiporter [Gemmatimonadetes bacterium]|nr:cation:proton antiporter [Gemmatimonadota bacterium]
MSQINLSLALIGTLVLLLGLSAGYVNSRARFVSEPMIAMLFGAAVGPAGLDLLDLSEWGDPGAILRELARLAVAMAVMAAALRLPKRFFSRHVATAGLLLGAGMVGMWAASTLLAWAFLPVPFLVALLLGAAVTPTDPVLAGAIVTGTTARRHIPDDVRSALTAEAGANDGLAYPFVMLPALLLTLPAAAGLRDWVLRTLLWETAGAVVLGLLLGSAAGRIESWAHDRDYAEHTSRLTISIALTAAVLGAVKLAGSGGLLAVFAAGLAFRVRANERDEHEQAGVQEAVNRLAGFPVLLLFGAMLPWRAWYASGLVLPLLALAILALRRPPTFLFLGRFVPLLATWKDVRFAAWFGPIGVAAIFYSLQAMHLTGEQVVWEAASMAIALSVLVHGASATPAVMSYPRRDAAEKRD